MQSHTINLQDNSITQYQLQMGIYRGVLNGRSWRVLSSNIKGNNMI